MLSLEYVKFHLNEFEQDEMLDSRFTKRLCKFLSAAEVKALGYEFGEGYVHTPKEWTEENVLNQLKDDVEFGYSKAVDQRGISCWLMYNVVNSWCKVLENGLGLDEDDAGNYAINQFTKVAEHYGWEL